MKELMLQRNGDTLQPFDPESLEIIRGFHENKPIRAKCTGAKKARSYQQLKAYWQACGIVADNLERFSDKHDTDWECRIKLRHIGRMTVAGNMVVVECKSISYANLDHAEANNYFDRAFELMARWLKIDKTELLRQSGGE